MLRKFDSGVMVIQNKAHSDDEVISLLILSSILSTVSVCLHFLCPASWFEVLG